jgi:hypothetical protein
MVVSRHARQFLLCASRTTGSNQCQPVRRGDAFDTRFRSELDPAGPNADVLAKRMVEHTYYVVEMAKLALILRTIVQARQKMRGELEFISSTHKQLEEWYSKLPTCLRLDSCSSDTTIQFLASPLALVYNCNLIYPHQPATASFPLSSTIPQDAVTSISDLGSSLVKNQRCSAYRKTRTVHSF